MERILGNVVEEEEGGKRGTKKKKKEMMLPHVISTMLLDIIKLRLHKRES